MTHSLTLNRAKEHIMRLQSTTRNARAKAGELMETAIEAVEIGGTAFAFGMWEGRAVDNKHFEIAGVPVPLATGVAGLGFGLFGVGRGMEKHFISIGCGALAAHLNGVGRRMGAEWKIKTSAALPPAAVRGDFGQPSMRGLGISEADLARMARG
jgi:hypothetical protein